jgi:oligoendopeptidase F
MTPYASDYGNAGKAPVWEWESLFPGGAEGSAFSAQERDLIARVAQLGTVFDSAGLDDDHTPARADDLFDGVLTSTCEVLAVERVLSLYLAAQCWERTDDPVASARYARFQTRTAGLAPLVDRLERWAAQLVLTGRLRTSPVVTGHDRWLKRCVREQEHRMDRFEHDADAARAATGRPAWERLYEDLAGTVTVALDGTSMTMNQAQQELNGTVASKRQQAQAAIETAWSALSVPATACVNAIKGDELRLIHKAGWDDALARSLFEQDIERPAFIAMQRAGEEARSVLHDFARVKATRLGLRQLGWSDLAAPLPDEDPLSWAEALDLITRAFTLYHPALAAHATSVTERGWVHAAPTSGKRPTALCLPLADGASRLMVTFDGSLDSVLSLAHELGHSYHYRLLAPCTDLQRRSPLTMLEVPSMVCEGLLISRPDASKPTRVAAGAERSARSEVHLLNAALIGSFQVMVGAHARFLFEQDVLESRARGPLTSVALTEMMREAQHTAYLDSLDPRTVSPTMWISHPHLYSSTLHSWPYSFALLLTLSLSATDGRLGVDPVDLDAALARTGTHSPAQVARTLGADLGDESFWHRGVDVLRARVDQFAAAGASVRPADLSQSKRTCTRSER